MVALPWLAPGDPFPAVTQALSDPDGLLAAGADLSPDTLLRAYRAGIFPWYSDGDPILWWSPDPRLILKPERFHTSRRLARTLRQPRFRFGLDEAFDRVIRACAHSPRPGQPGTWIVADMIEAYERLHRAGHAHALSVWSSDGELVGGIYGVHIGGVFFGESMFSQQRDASKCAMAALCLLAPLLNIRLIDCQVSSPHLLSLGAETWPRQQFSDELARLVDLPTADWPHWSPRPFDRLCAQSRLD